MEAYTGFAAVYDTFMDNVPYEEWCGYIKSLLMEQGVKEGLVLDLGCGTGSLAELLSAAGYDMIGVDASEEMLELAYEKKAVSGSDILYLCQDMRELELYGTVEAVISVCDCMNYILEYEDLVQVFRLVNNYLDPGGVFIFDLNTEYKYETVMGDRVIAEDREDAAFIWDNQYDAKERINIYDLSIFVKEEGQEEDGLYRKYHETHYQRAYSIDEIMKAVEEGGLKLEAVYDAFTREKPKEDSQRIYVIAREQGKSREEEEK